MAADVPAESENDDDGESSGEQENEEVELGAPPTEGNLTQHTMVLHAGQPKVPDISDVLSPTAPTAPTAPEPPTRPQRPERPVAPAAPLAASEAPPPVDEQPRFDEGVTAAFPVGHIPSPPEPAAPVTNQPTSFDPNVTATFAAGPDTTGPAAASSPPFDPNATAVFPAGSAPPRDVPPDPPPPGLTPTELIPPDPPDQNATVLLTSVDPEPAGYPSLITAPLADPTDESPLSGPTTGDANPHPPPGLAPGSDPTQPAKKSGLRRILLWLLVVAVAVIAILVLVWAVDSIRTRGEVARGTNLGTIPIGGLDDEGLDGVIDDLNDDLATSEVQLLIGDLDLTTDLASLGAVVDRETVKELALSARREGMVFTAPIRWLNTFFSDVAIEPVYTVDELTTTEKVEEINTTSLDQVQEPELALLGGAFSVRRGAAGQWIDSAEVVEVLSDELENSAPYRLTLTANIAEPEISNEELEAVAAEATEATEGRVAIRLLDQTVELDSQKLRDWVEVDTSGSGPTWLIDDDAVLENLKPQFLDLGSEDQLARFNVVDNKPIIIPAAETVVCCSAESIAGIKEQLLEDQPVEVVDTEDDDDELGPQRLVILQPEIVGSDEGVTELESLGIIEEVSTFTTMHACCQNRVTNIQRFADLTTGVIIRPGEKLSLNEHVGRRTTEKGFVADGAIANGILEKQVGGGVSQFATTFFNAAFYAGIDFNEYQSHSLYISRYPRGREATISFPRPDLSVTNTTEYGILVWATYTPTSITVTFYSTKHIKVDELALIRSSRGECSIYTTPRVRTYPDGEVVEDTVFALYRPAEGKDCNGNDTTPAGPTKTDETVVPPTPPVEPSPVDPVDPELVEPSPIEPAPVEPVVDPTEGEAAPVDS